MPRCGAPIPLQRASATNVAGVGRELAGAVERKGWLLLRVHGSHHVYGKDGSVVRLDCQYLRTTIVL
jgi:hypothetical protein